MVCLREVENIARILNQSMLEAASGAEERPSLLSGKTNPAQGSLHAAVGATRGTPQRIARLKDSCHSPLSEFRGGKPRNGDWGSKSVRSVLQGFVGRPVRFSLRVEI